MRRLSLLAALVLVVVAIAAPATAKQDKEWVCHLTHSETNPVILVHVANGWDNGHGNQKVSLHQLHDALYVGSEPVKAGPAPQEIVDNMLSKGLCDFGEIEDPED